MVKSNHVRCRYCDSAFFVTDIKITILPPDEICKHGMGAFTCPACGYHSISYIFPPEEE
jgi:hypothetical protein